ncbi:hypothetical protein [Hymenobacter sp. IS2118]|uniref:hypothetical protein n=1 Tax=Hymenobacter sp. IS2118 TaxID=1505605 RepID=UPI0013789654|nr:hypothetical protein [Hymenobacter sp. IS2118]
MPSKSLIHAARQMHKARQATQFGLPMSGAADIGKVLYVQGRRATGSRPERLDVH